MSSNSNHHNGAASVVAMLQGCLYGLVAAILSGILNEDPWNKSTPLQKGVIASALLFGATFRCLFAGLLSD
ncbi:MAG: hypothetical protein EZS28_052288 [Streblomastix strix]|uniref:Uncharacterized protein n=1 Tax=Streblomastix strix TaxID=222440 RepID=A0A5J4SEF6_9EUKA|nr:MAG: hypothetical protein EZS28_052288 [Streblomastix strix]